MPNDQSRADVVCVGHAIVDWVSFVEPGVAEGLGLSPGAMTLVDREAAERIGAALPGGRRSSGGSAANTAAGIAALGGSPVFVGAVGDDELGSRYAADLEAAGVACALEVAAGGAGGVWAGEAGNAPDAGGEGGTGRCMVLVTPDAERTMATYLGAAGALGTAAVERARIGEARALYIEGYLFDAPRAAPALADAQVIARAAGALLALSLSDPFVVERHHDTLAELVAGAVDVLFCNEEELAALTGVAGPHAGAAALQREGLVAFVTRGEKGALVVTADGVLEVPARSVPEVVDTTGAGDLFAAGALLGLVRGETPERSAELGALAAAEVITHAGARPLVPLADLARDAGLLPPR